jgi:hypothetical protein
MYVCMYMYYIYTHNTLCRGFYPARAILSSRQTIHACMHDMHTCAHKYVMSLHTNAPHIHTHIHDTRTPACIHSHTSTCSQKCVHIQNTHTCNTPCHLFRAFPPHPSGRAVPGSRICPPDLFHLHLPFHPSRQRHLFICMCMYVSVCVCMCHGGVVICPPHIDKLIFTLLVRLLVYLCVRVCVDVSWKNRYLCTHQHTHMMN